MEEIGKKKKNHKEFINYFSNYRNQKLNQY